MNHSPRVRLLLPGILALFAICGADAGGTAEIRLAQQPSPQYQDPGQYPQAQQEQQPTQYQQPAQYQNPEGYPPQQEYPPTQAPPQYQEPQQIEQQQYQQLQQQQPQYQQYQQPAAPVQQPWTPPPTPAPPPSTASVPGGGCKVKLSVDRSTIHLLDASGSTEQKHVSLGQDRVQRVFNSPDGGWSVAVYKIRGEQQFGFVAIDLAACEEQLPVEVASVPSSAAFEGSEVVLTFEAGEMRFRLKNQIVQ